MTQDWSGRPKNHLVAGCTARRLEIPRAPARLQRWISSLTQMRTSLILVCVPLKTHRLQWFQMAQAPKMIIELRPFCTGPTRALLAPSHQSSKEEVPSWGERFWRPIDWRRLNQNYQVKTQETRRWFKVSSSWSHNRHLWGWGKPFFANRSAVQHLPCATSHMKNLHFPGA